MCLLHPVEEHNGYFVIDEAYGGCGYEWTLVAAMYHPEQDAYFLYEDGGCSCSGPYEDWSGTFHPGSEPMSKAQIIKNLNSMRSDDLGYDLRLEDMLELAQAVREFDPKEIN